MRREAVFGCKQRPSPLIIKNFVLSGESIGREATGQKYQEEEDAGRETYSTPRQREREDSSRTKGAIVLNRFEFHVLILLPSACRSDPTLSGCVCYCNSGSFCINYVYRGIHRYLVQT